MTVKQLIAELEKLPQDAEVIKANYDGCLECNPDGLPEYHEVYGAHFHAEGDYPNHRRKDIVVL